MVHTPYDPMEWENDQAPSINKSNLRKIDDELVYLDRTLANDETISNMRFKSVNDALTQNSYDNFLGVYYSEQNAYNVWLVFVPFGSGYIEAGKQYKIYCPYISDGTYTCMTYKVDKTTQTNAYLLTFSGGYATFQFTTITSDTAYIRLTLGTADSFKYGYACLYRANIDSVKKILNDFSTELGQYSDSIEENYEASHIINENLVALTKNSGSYLDSSGGVTSTTAPYYYSDMITVASGEKYHIKGTNIGPAAYFWCMYNGSTKVEISEAGTGASSTMDKDYYLTIPSGVNKLRLCWYGGANNIYCAKLTSQKVSDLINDVGKEISILFVGNSLTQDAIAYLPYVLKQIKPELKYKFYIWYNGGKTLAQQYEYFTNNTPCEIFSEAENVVVWTNYTNSKTMSYILSNYEFDVVCMQEYFNYKSTYTDSDLVDWNNCRDYIVSNYTGGNSLEFISLFHAPLRATATSVFNMLKTGNGLILNKTISQDMIPAGIAIYRALSTSLDNLGDQGHLSPDGTHAQEGLPCLLQTFCVVAWLFDKLGYFQSVYGSPIRITTEIYNMLNVPGPNLGTGVITGTDAENLLAQEVAIKAFKEGKKFVLDNLYVTN